MSQAGWGWQGARSFAQGRPRGTPLKLPFFYQGHTFLVKAHQDWADIACCCEPASFYKDVKGVVARFVASGQSPWSYKSIGEKPRVNRNIKAIRLTELGELVARQLQVKSQTHSSDLTRTTIQVEPPPPPPPLTEAEQEARRQLLAEAEAAIAGRSP